jgi:hypothetical protein
LASEGEKKGKKDVEANRGSLLLNMSLIRSVATRALRPQLRAAQHQVLYRGFATAQADVQAAASAVLLHLDREAIGWTIDGQLDGAVQVVNSDFIVSGLGEDGTEKIAVSVAEEFDGFEEKFVMSVGEESVTVTDVSYATAMSPGLEVHGMRVTYVEC